jgi:hypothetical protein
MASLAYLLAVVLDPVQAALVLAIVLAYRGPHPVIVGGTVAARGPHPVIVGGTVAAAASEAIMVAAASGYPWGEFVLPRLVACLMQAAVLHWIVVRAIPRPSEAGDTARRGLWRLGMINRLPSPAVAAVGRPQERSQSQRLAHMRAYVRRRLARLRGR